MIEGHLRIGWPSIPCRSCAISRATSNHLTLASFWPLARRSLAWLTALGQACSPYSSIMDLAVRVISRPVARAEAPLRSIVRRPAVSFSGCRGLRSFSEICRPLRDNDRGPSSIRDFSVNDCLICWRFRLYFIAAITHDIRPMARLSARIPIQRNCYGINLRRIALSLPGCIARFQPCGSSRSC